MANKNMELAKDLTFGTELEYTNITTLVKCFWGD